MDNNKKHIDDFFKEELDDHTEPISSEELDLFEKSIGIGTTKRRFINPKYLKWLPYLAGLSAAAAVGYVATPLFNNKTKINEPSKTKTIVYKKQEKQLNQIPTNPVDTFLTHTMVSTKPIKTKISPEYKITLPGLVKITSASLAYFPESGTKKSSLLNETSKKVKSILKTTQYFPRGGKRLNTLGSDNSIDITFNLGVETNTKFSAITSSVASMQLRYKVAPKLFVGIQPGFKIGNISQIPLPQRLTFYNTPYQNVEIRNNQTIPGSYDYHYTEIYDSIDASYSLKKNMWDVELPIFWEYAFSKKVSLTAGIKFVYGKIPEINKIETRYSKIHKDSLIEVPFMFPPDNGIVLFEPRCNCISDDETAYQNPSEMRLRTGYTLGINVRPIDKMLINISVHQNSSDLSYIPNPDIRNIYNATRLRFSLGYKINRNHK